MNPCLVALFSLAVPSPAVQTVPGDRCEKLTQLVKSTYDFVPAKLGDAGRPAKFAAMDEVWKLAKSAPQTFASCLRSMLTAPDAQPWFLCDGSALLAEIEPTKESLELQARLWCATSMDI